MTPPHLLCSSLRCALNLHCSLVTTACDSFSGKEATAEDASATSSAGAGAFAAPSPAPVGPEPSTSKLGEGEGGAAHATGEDKEDDAAAVTAVIWKELAELSAVQAKLKVSLLLALPLALLFVRAGLPHPSQGAGGEGGGQSNWGLDMLEWHAADSMAF